MPGGKRGAERRGREGTSRATPPGHHGAVDAERGTERVDHRFCAGAHRQIGGGGRGDRLGQIPGHAQGPRLGVGALGEHEQRRGKVRECGDHQSATAYFDQRELGLVAGGGGAGRANTEVHRAVAEGVEARDAVGLGGRGGEGRQGDAKRGAGRVGHGQPGWSGAERGGIAPGAAAGVRRPGLRSAAFARGGGLTGTESVACGNTERHRSLRPASGHVGSPPL